MEKTSLSKWLKFITILVGVLGLIITFVFVPARGVDIMQAMTEISFLFWPCLIFVWILAIPCFWALIEFWKICCEIDKDRSFSMKNARSLATISRLAIIDVAIWFVGLGALNLFLKMSILPIILLFSVVVITVGVGIAILTAALSHLTEKAAKIKDENDLVI